MAYIRKGKVQIMNNRGSITIFFSMILMVVISVVCAALEAARYSCVSCILSMTSDSVADSVFAGYDRQLWDKYRLLFYPYPDMMAASAEEYADSYFGFNLESPLVNVWGIKDVSVSIDNKISVYDNGGLPFLDSVSAYMRSNSIEIKPEEYERSEEIVKAAMQIGEEFEDLMNGSKQELIDLLSRLSDSNITIQDLENNNKVIECLNKSAFSEIISFSSLSANEINSSGLSSGIFDKYNKVLQYTDQDFEFLYQYIDMFLNSYTCFEPDNSELIYEQEYVLYGMASDKENLEETINQLIKLREGINYSSICGSKELMTKAYCAAEGFVHNMHDIEAAVKLICILWTYAESVNDVKGLINGGFLLLEKGSDDWNIDVNDALTGNWDQELKGEGLNYQEYLQLLFRLQAKDDVCLRVMDIIDSNMRISEKDFLLANCIYNANLKLDFDVESKFILISAIKSISGKAIKEYKITKSCNGGYA